MGDLSERTRLSKQTMTTLIRNMEQADLVERRKDPKDGRATQVFLTDRSRAFRPVAERVLAQMDSQVAILLTANEIGQLKNALKTLRMLEI